MLNTVYHYSREREREREGGGERERGDKMKTDIRSEIETDKEG